MNFITVEQLKFSLKYHIPVSVFHEQIREYSTQTLLALGNNLIGLGSVATIDLNKTAPGDVVRNVFPSPELAALSGKPTTITPTPLLPPTPRRPVDSMPDVGAVEGVTLHANPIPFETPEGLTALTLNEMRVAAGAGRPVTAALYYPRPHAHEIRNTRNVTLTHVRDWEFEYTEGRTVNLCRGNKRMHEVVYDFDATKGTVRFFPLPQIDYSGEYNPTVPWQEERKREERRLELEHREAEAPHIKAYRERMRRTSEGRREKEKSPQVEEKAPTTPQPRPLFRSHTPAALRPSRSTNRSHELDDRLTILRLFSQNLPTPPTPNLLPEDEDIAWLQFFELETGIRCPR